MDSGFIGGVALQNYQRGLQAQANVRREHDKPVRLSVHDANPSTTARQRPMPAPIDTNLVTRPLPQVLHQPHRPVSSFFTSTPSQNTAPAASARRPAGTRLAPEPSSLPPNPINVGPPRTKKSLPFLRNSVSTLLMRRKNSHNAPDLLPLPLENSSDEPTYDFRIKGTRVHDFSAPRPKSHITLKADLPDRSPSRPYSAVQERPLARLLTDDPEHALSQNQQEKTTDNESTGRSLNSQVPVLDPKYSSATPKPTSTQRRRPVPLKDDTNSSFESQAANMARMKDDLMISPPRAADSTRTTRSRNVSVSSNFSASAIPRHMKSTSSRFSFDMIGAATQEKIMEERHRQREAEKQVAQQAQPQENDSRFDEFDDEFDYDAMIDDDGLEERIPGVNADYDEDEDYNYEEDYCQEGEFCHEEDVDPDNDQENFAGFSFQRSNGTSALPTPQSTAFTRTPRDAQGNLIGFAQTKDSPYLQESALPPGPEVSQSQQDVETFPAGLGIQEVGVQYETGPGSDQPEESLTAGIGSQANKVEDLYFDDGMVGYEDEFAEDLASNSSFAGGEPFDESIFDNNDTDKYGRPIAGAFAQAQAQAQQQRAANQDSIKRESDMISSLSPHSGVSLRSTVQTSPSMEIPCKELDEPLRDTFQDLEVAPGSFVPEKDSIEAYQAALAAAARNAAASGKFQRDPSPSVHGAPNQPNGGLIEACDLEADECAGYDDDYVYSYENMNDFELDDDAIIAEANADALAYDSDGWYGQEFGFYSAPINQHHGSHSSGSSTKGTEYEYANGGFFGPKGMNGVNRNDSGRIVSREPNLTPITERSEYSNRNSLAVPGHGFGTPIPSPGLAQLAMIADRGDEMSMSALLRLRSKAWGGSQASLVSSMEGSPKSERGDMAHSPWTANSGGNPFSNLWHARKESEPGSASASPTVALGPSNSAPPFPGQILIPLPPGSRLSASSQPEKQRATTVPGLNPNRLSLSAVGSSQANWNTNSAVSGGHKHQSSAESISYTKEDEGGELRWVVERRRVSVTGEVEVLEREVVNGGRI